VAMAHGEKLGVQMIWLVRDKDELILAAYNNEAAASMHASDVPNSYVDALELDVEQDYREKQNDEA
jgi:hypothetical protein